MDILKVVFTSLFSAISLFLIAKIIGHKQISQLDFFDYINGITIGSIAAEMATELEKPLRPLVAMLVYGFISVLLSLIMSKLPKSRKFINGTPIIIMNGGKIYRKNMKKARLDLSEFMLLCRHQGFFNLNDIQTAVFEYNGTLTILPVCTKRPLNPFDMNIQPSPEGICTEIIMDGVIMSDNLKRAGLDKNWLKNELRAQGIKSEKEVFLAVTDVDNKLSVFKNE